jgi:uncharacterized protein YcfJ
MKRRLIAVTIALVGGNACAGDFVDTAQVVSSTPVIERVADSRQQCDPAPAPQKSSNILAPIIGGLLGGLLGHQVGQGSGQTAATIVGAAGGAVAGNMVGNRAGTQPAQQCRTVESSRDVVRGYDVVYRYNGHEVTTNLPYDPGSTVKVAVGIADDGQSADSRRSGYREERQMNSANARDDYDDRSSRRRDDPQ